MIKEILGKKLVIIWQPKKKNILLRLFTSICNYCYNYFTCRHLFLYNSFTSRKNHKNNIPWHQKNRCSNISDNHQIASFKQEVSNHWRLFKNICRIIYQFIFWMILITLTNFHFHKSYPYMRMYSLETLQSWSISRLDWNLSCYKYIRYHYRIPRIRMYIFIEYLNNENKFDLIKNNFTGRTISSISLCNYRLFFSYAIIIMFMSKINPHSTLLFPIIFITTIFVS